MKIERPFERGERLRAEAQKNRDAAKKSADLRQCASNSNQVRMLLGAGWDEERKRNKRPLEVHQGQVNE
jgi:hypothetical protein